MATKKKGKKATKSKRTPAKKRSATKGASKKKAPKKLTAKKQAGTTPKKATRSAGTSGRKPPRSSGPKRAAFELQTGPRSGGQSGDLQGLRDLESADSESVGELLEEGNAIEAGIVSGVEHVEDNEEAEVHTHEVPEDDVPEEYLDKDE